MIEKMPINLKILLTLSDEIFTEERSGIIYECRKLKGEEENESCEIRKKRAAMSVILAKIQRIDDKD